MTRKISQEGLKLIACITMLIDHAGLLFANNYGTYHTMRIIGRIAFPIFAFLVAEGAAHTRKPKKYAIRLAVGAVLSELPFDFTFFGGVYWGHQNVMVTLLLGYLAIQHMEKCPNLIWKALAAIPFALVAKILKSDYAWEGVLMIAMFWLARDLPGKWPVLTVGLLVLCHFIGGAYIPILGFRVSTQLFGVFALVPIALYSGEKHFHGKVAQRVFYLFYPVHLLVLYLIGRI